MIHRDYEPSVLTHIFINNNKNKTKTKN